MHTILLKLQNNIKNQLLHVLGPIGPSSQSTELYRTTPTWCWANNVQNMQYLVFFFNIIVILIKLCAFVGLNYYNPIQSLINISCLWN